MRTKEKRERLPFLLSSPPPPTFPSSYLTEQGRKDRGHAWDVSGARWDTESRVKIGCMFGFRELQVGRREGRALSL